MKRWHVVTLRDPVTLEVLLLPENGGTRDAVISLPSTSDSYYRRGLKDRGIEDLDHVPAEETISLLQAAVETLKAEASTDGRLAHGELTTLLAFAHLRPDGVWWVG